MSTYLETVSGRKIDFADPDPDQIVVEDIVHALRHICRFGGHILKPLSVMAHSANVALLVPDKFKYEAILHDAAEAYIGDMPTPFKLMMPDFLSLEARIQAAINTKFGLPDRMSQVVVNADRVALMTERDFLKPASGDWGSMYEGTVRVPISTFDFSTQPADYYIGYIRHYEEMRHA